MSTAFFLIIGCLIGITLSILILSSLFYKKPKILPIINDMEIDTKKDLKYITVLLIAMTIIITHIWPILFLIAGIKWGLNLFI